MDATVAESNPKPMQKTRANIPAKKTFCFCLQLNPEFMTSSSACPGGIVRNSELQCLHSNSLDKNQFKSLFRMDVADPTS
jgi:hypothetical protein